MADVVLCHGSFVLIVFSWYMWHECNLLLFVDDGKLFQGSGVGDPFGPRCFEGDIMGCGIMFPRDYSLDGGGEHLVCGLQSHVSHLVQSLTFFLFFCFLFFRWRRWLGSRGVSQTKRGSEWLVCKQWRWGGRGRRCGGEEGCGEMLSKLWNIKTRDS